MALNNNVNNTLTNPTITGTTSICSTSGALTIGSSSAGAFTINSNSSSTWAAQGTSFNILTGTGDINLATGNTAGTITIGNGGGGNGNNMNILSTGLNITASANTGPVTFTKQGTGDFVFSHSGANLTFEGPNNQTVNIANTTTPSSIQIGNNSSSLNTTIGNTTTTTGITFTTGSGTINIGTSIAKTITIGTTTAASNLTLQVGTGGFQLPTIEVTGTSVTLAVGINYIMNNASQITATLPTTAAIGTVIRICGNGAGGWKIAQNASQQINSTAASTTNGITGSLSSGGQYDCVELVCGVVNNQWTIKDSTGTLSFA